METLRLQCPHAPQQPVLIWFEETQSGRALRAASGSNSAGDFSRGAALRDQRGEVQAGLDLLAYLHEDETEPVAAIAGATWTDTVLLFASRK